MMQWFWLLPIYSIIFPLFSPILIHLFVPRLVLCWAISVVDLPSFMIHSHASSYCIFSLFVFFLLLILFIFSCFLLFQSYYRIRFLLLLLITSFPCLLAWLLAAAILIPPHGNFPVWDWECRFPFWQACPIISSFYHPSIWPFPPIFVSPFPVFCASPLLFLLCRLCTLLEPSIPSLVSLLRDPSSKTRANAAGALGNLARHSSCLVAALLESHVVEALWTLIMEEEQQQKQNRKYEPQARAASANSSSASATPFAVPGPQAIALVSLSNLAAHQPCLNILRSLDPIPVLTSLSNTHYSLSVSVSRLLSQIAWMSDDRIDTQWTLSYSRMSIHFV